jgi:hypothetical protein
MVKKLRVIITIITHERRSFWYDYEENASINYIEVFKDFYKWFYLKKSEYYSFHHKTGIIIFIRSEIKQIEFEKHIIEFDKSNPPPRDE